MPVIDTSPAPPEVIVAEETSMPRSFVYPVPPVPAIVTSPPDELTVMFAMEMP